MAAYVSVGLLASKVRSGLQTNSIEQGCSFVSIATQLRYPDNAGAVPPTLRNLLMAPHVQTHKGARKASHVTEGSDTATWIG
jgi:hypothetical protein